MTVTNPADLVVRATSTGQVAHLVADARAAGVPLAVRAGGHSVAGHSRPDGGALLDLSGLSDLVVTDPGEGLVSVGGGATWGDVARDLASYGLAISSGDTAGVGVAGLTLGGGIGWMVRRYGLALDALVGAEVVTADGQVREVDADRHPDLFWALRGGGGNLGVVTRFDFVAQRVSTVVEGTVGYDLDVLRAAASGELAALVAGWRDHLRGSDDRLTSVLVVTPASPRGPASVTVRWCYAGDDLAAAQRETAVLRRLAPVAVAGAEPVPYPELLEEAAAPGHGPGGGAPPMRLAVNNALLPALTDAAIDDLVRLVAGPPTVVVLRSLGGALGWVDAEATAFAHRDAEVMAVAVRTAPASAPVPRLGRTDGGDFAGVARHGTGAYVGFLSDAGPADVAAAYPGPTYARLAAVKDTYDPDNLFRRNHNVVPASASRRV